MQVSRPTRTTMYQPTKIHLATEVICLTGVDLMIFIAGQSGEGESWFWIIKLVIISISREASKLYATILHRK